MANQAVAAPRRLITRVRQDDAVMSGGEESAEQQAESSSGRRSFFYTVFGGVLAALAGWISGALPREAGIPEEVDSGATPADSRISALEAAVAQLAQELLGLRSIPPLAQLEGEFDERVVFNKRESSPSPIPKGCWSIWWRPEGTSQDDPKEVILHDTVDGSAYSLRATNGQLALTRA